MRRKIGEDSDPDAIFDKCGSLLSNPFNSSLTPTTFQQSRIMRYEQIFFVFVDGRERKENPPSKNSWTREISMKSLGVSLLGGDYRGAIGRASNRGKRNKRCFIA